MKSKTLKRTETFAGALLLTLLLACEPAKQTSAETKDTTPAAAPPAPAAGMVRYEAQPSGSKCTIAGSSTVHDWTMETALISGYLVADANFPESALTSPAAAKPEVKTSMPVKSFKSGKQAMDQKMQDTLSATNYPKFEYRLIELKPRSKPGDKGALQFDAIGVLTIVGNTATNTMPVTIEKVGNKLKVVGSTPIKFTEYKMKPPVIRILGFDAMSVGDDLKINFEWTLAPKAAPAPPPAK